MEEKPIPYPDMTPEQTIKMAQLTNIDLSEIDKLILSNSSIHWQKQAMVITKTMNELDCRHPDIPDIFYAERINKLVKEGYLESQGNLKYMRFSEVRLPTPEQK
jgi:hypothetical protein